MITSFGKFCRILRINNGEVLKDMAQKLGVTVSYLSAVENGNRKVPNNWYQLICENYSLSEIEKLQLNDAIFDSQKEISFKLDSYSDNDKELLLSFARKFDSLEENRKKQLKKLFEEAL